MRDYLGRAYALVFPRHYRSKTLVMFRAYLDASKDQTERLLCLAGYLADLAEWRRFTTQWKRVLHRADPSLSYFHMTDFMSRQAKPYSTWNDRKRKAVLAALVDCVVENVKGGLFTALSRPALQGMPPEKRRHLTDEYSLVATSCIGAVAKLLRDTKRKEKVAYVFELGDEGGGRFNASINGLMQQTVYQDVFRVLSVSMEDKRNAVGLQAADMLAWAAALVLSRDVIPGDPQLRRLVEKGVIYRLLGEDALNDLAQFSEAKGDALLRAFSQGSASNSFPKHDP